MRRMFWTLTASALLAAACSSGDDTSSVDDAADTAVEDDSGDDVEEVGADVVAASRIVVSDDGNAMVVAPPGEEGEITVDVLAAEDYPAFLRGAQVGPGTVVYDLGPEGATFDEPVRFFRRLEVANLGPDLAALDVPIILLVTADAEGSPELLDEYTILRTPGEVWVGADVTHFSPQVTVNVQVDAETNALFGDLIRSVQNDDGSQAVTVLAEATPILPEPTDEDVDRAFDAAIEPMFTEAVHGSAAAGSESADRWLTRGESTGYVARPAPGASGIITGGYLFPPAVADTHDTADIDYDHPRDVDFFRPLALRFPGARSGPATPSAAAVMAVGATVTIDNPLFDGAVDVSFDLGILLVDEAAIEDFGDAVTRLLSELGFDEPDGPDVAGEPDVVAVDTSYLDTFPYLTAVAHPGGPSSEVDHTMTIPPGDGGLQELLDLFPSDLYAFTATQGGPGAPAQLVGFSPLIQQDRTATATTDIFCYCRHVTGLLLSPGSAPPPAAELSVLVDDDGTFTMLFDGNEVPAPVTLFRDGDGNAIVTDVGPDEGPAFQGEASLRFEIPAEMFADGFESGDVSPWSTTRG